MKKNVSPAKNYKSELLNEILNQIPAKELERTKQRMLLAGKIKDAMDKKGWNNTRLAKELDKNPSEITKWLSGTHNFTADTLFDIQDVLEIELILLKEKEVVQPVIHMYLEVKSDDVISSSWKGNVNEGIYWNASMSKKISKVKQASFSIN